MNARRRFSFTNHLGQLIVCDGRQTRVSQPGSATLDRMPDDQQWFWTPEWQDGERESSEAIAAGEVVTFTNDEDFMAWLAADGNSSVGVREPPE